MNIGFPIALKGAEDFPFYFHVVCHCNQVKFHNIQSDENGILTFSVRIYLIIFV
jgi:hypothetical protein